jgi:Cdc6-like AAA superfamily ATPase
LPEHITVQLDDTQVFLIGKALSTVNYIQKNIDEIDAMRHDSDRKLTAELMKHLSDNGSEVTIFAVGIAKSCSDLLAGHASAQRCIREVKLHPMTPSETRAIVHNGAREARLDFDEIVVKRIVELSSGYPYFAHLLALKCAENAIGEGRNLIRRHDMTVAIGTAVRDAEVSLKDHYESAVLSTQTEMYKHIVHGAALLDPGDFNSTALREQVSFLADRKVLQSEINNCLPRLVSANGSTVLHRAKKGIYRFSDPRMRSFIRLCAASAYGVVDPNV